MADRMLHTKDGVPLVDILNEGQQILDLFNDAPRTVRETLGQNVSDQQFRVFAGDLTWEELGEGEHARTGDTESFEMAFGVKKYGRALGMTQELIEDHSADYVLRRFEALVEGALQAEHDVVFSTIRNGWADGSGLWFDPEDYGAYSFENDHNHVFADTTALTGEASATMEEHLYAAQEEVEHHGKVADVALVSSEGARKLVNELAWGPSYNIPTFEDLRTTGFPENGIQIDGMRVYKTRWLTDDEVHVIAGSERPLYFHERRPVQITNGSTGGPVGDPGALLGAYGSARYGAVVPDPLAGVSFNATNVA